MWTARRRATPPLDRPRYRAVHLSPTLAPFSAPVYVPEHWGAAWMSFSSSDFASWASLVVGILSLVGTIVGIIIAIRLHNGLPPISEGLTRRWHRAVATFRTWRSVLSRVVRRFAATVAVVVGGIAMFATLVAVILKMLFPDPPVPPNDFARTGPLASKVRHLSCWRPSNDAGRICAAAMSFLNVTSESQTAQALEFEASVPGREDGFEVISGRGRAFELIPPGRTRRGIVFFRPEPAPPLDEYRLWIAAQGEDDRREFIAPVDPVPPFPPPDGEPFNEGLGRSGQLILEWRRKGERP